MADPTKVPTSELQRIRDLGAISYMSAYCYLMMRELGVDGLQDGETWRQLTTDMVLLMVEPMNHATEAIWRATMRDTEGMEKALLRFRASLHAL